MLRMQNMILNPVAYALTVKFMRIENCIKSNYLQISESVNLLHSLTEKIISTLTSSE